MIDHPPVEITTYYLEMLNCAEYQPPRASKVAAELRRVETPLPELNRFLYATVGRDWDWADRLSWPRERWIEWLDRPQLETWIAWVGGTPAGYYELEQQPEQNVEIAYFGLLPQFAGQGLGGWLLGQAIERGWESGARRVWVHTCSLDHPHALANYLARGFKQYRQETTLQHRAPRSSWPWCG